MVLLLCSVTSVTAAKKTTSLPTPDQISVFNEDLTGDGKKESIALKGIQFSNESTFLKDIWANIEMNNQRWKISYDGGYKPVLQFMDLNHDKVYDVFYKSSKKVNGNAYHHQLNTLKNGTLKKIPLPTQRYIKVQFADNFQIQVQLSPNEKAVTTSFKKRASEYIQHGIYTKNGELLADATVNEEPIASYNPVFISKQKGYGLKSRQPIKGISKDDTLGTIDTLWYFENGKWVILKTKWNPANQNKKS